MSARGEGREPGAADADAVTRRDALKALAAVPVAAAFRWEGAPFSAAWESINAHVAAPAPFVARFFTPHEFATVRLLVDVIIPRDARSGSATDAKVPEFIDYIMAWKDTPAGDRTAMRGGLAWLDAECRRRNGHTFLESTHEGRAAVLDDIAWPAKAKPDMGYGVTFFNDIRDLTATGFFSSAMGYQDLRYIGNVFNPNWQGCPPAALEKLGVSYE